jgi:hypothetical protein
MTEIDERELWNFAAFRLREAVRRIRDLSSEAESKELRTELREISLRLRAELDRLIVLADRPNVEENAQPEVAEAVAQGSTAAGAVYAVPPLARTGQGRAPLALANEGLRLVPGRRVSNDPERLRAGRRVASR